MRSWGRVMKFIAFLAALCCAGVAQATEIPLNPPNVSYPWRDKPARPWEVPAGVANWQGIYVGGFGGYASQTNTPVVGWNQQHGAFGGGTVGWQGQWDQLVAGIEADVAWGDVRASSTAVVLPFATIATLTSRMNDMGTIRGRIGYAFGQVLLYGTGGFAWARNRLTAVGVLTLPPFTFTGTAVDTVNHGGWTAGGGVEWMFAPQWSVKAEYLYRSFESRTYFSNVFGGLTSGKLNTNTVQVGVNVHF